MYKIVASYDRGPFTYSVNSEEEALEVMDQLYEGDVPCRATDQYGNTVDENDLTDIIEAREAPDA